MSTLRLPVPSSPAAPSSGTDSDSEPGHLTVRLDRPDQATRTAVLYCHGFASSQSGEKADFLRQCFLEAGLAFCSFDFRGHGESSGELFDISMTRNLEDLSTVHAHLRSEGLDRIILFGSSMGGGVSAWYATEYSSQLPGEILAAIFIAPGLEMAEGLLRRVGPEKAASWREEGKVHFPHELGDYWLSWQLIEDLRGYSRFRLAHEYRTPTLIFQGMQDEIVDWRAVVDFANGSEAAVQTLLFSDGDHRLLGRLATMWRQTESFLLDLGILES